MEAPTYRGYAIGLLEERIHQLEGFIDQLQTHNTELVMKYRTAEQQVKLERESAWRSFQTQIHGLQLDQETSDRDRGWNAAIRQILSLFAQQPVCSICLKYGCSTCHSPDERCGCARDGRT